MAINSKKELLEWLALKPRTEGWGAVVAYNRKKCNDLLLQDYIQKFTTDSYLPPISEPVPTGEANWELLHDWVTTQPRLSFENSSKTAGGEARMTMAVVGGSQISIDGVLGHKRAIAIKSLDALDYPELIAEDVALSKTSGTVGKDTGEVVLDLGNPVTAQGMWELTFANTQHERRKGGEFFKKYYRNADPKKRLYHLGKIAYTDQQYLKPQSFILRTTTAPGAASRDSNNFGDGAVELFVRMQGEAEGGLPPTDDWRSLIPDDVEGEYDCSILLSNKIVMEDIFAVGAGKIFNSSREMFEVALDNGFASRLLVVQDKSFSVSPSPYVEGSLKVIIPPFEIVAIPTVEGSHGFVLTLKKNETIEVFSSGSYLINVEVQREGSSNSLEARIGFNNLARCGFNVVPDSNGVKIVLAPVSGELMWPTLSIRTNSIISPAETVRLEQSFATELKALVSTRFNMFFGMSYEIDTFVLHSLLFNNDAVISKSIDLPGDMAVFGQIASLFTITSHDHLMGHGATHPFKVSPDFTGNVKWSVKAVPGSTSASGTINADTGLYTSPAIGDIDGTYTRVIVTATDTSSTFSSSTLVTVVVRDITVNPVVQICNASPDSGAPVTRTLSANTLGEGVLEWKVIKGDGSIPSRAGPDGKNVYTAGMKNPDIEGTFTVDEIEVKNLATGKTQVVYVLVNHYPQILKTVIDMEQSSLPAGKAQFKVTGDRDRPVTAVLEVVAGNGSVDSSGMYTSDPASAHRFALVKATKDDDDGWILLTYPLIELPDKPIDDLESY